MVFKKPRVEVIDIEMDNVITASCVSLANANPSIQACSEGSAHEGDCTSEADDWA